MSSSIPSVLPPDATLAADGDAPATLGAEVSSRQALRLAERAERRAARLPGDAAAQHRSAARVLRKQAARSQF